MTTTNPIVRFPCAMFRMDEPKTNRAAVSLFALAVLLLPFTWFTFAPLLDDHIDECADRIVGGLGLSFVAVMFGWLACLFSPPWWLVVVLGYVGMVGMLVVIGVIVNVGDWLDREIGD